MLDELSLTSEPDADPLEIAVLSAGINERNMDVTGWRDYRKIVHFIRDAAGVIVGGIAGQLWGGWLYVDELWVAERYRRRGWGSRLLLAAEVEAASASARHAYLETYSFQARPFYERRGYRVVGELTDFPPGESYYLMAKDLA